MTLLQGAVYWQPPEQALEKVKEKAWVPSTSQYGTHEGLIELREALTKKVLIVHFDNNGIRIEKLFQVPEMKETLVCSYSMRMDCTSLPLW